MSVSGLRGAARSDVAFVYAPELTRWRLAPGHPFEPRRVEALVDLLTTWGILGPDDLLPPAPLGEGELARVHDEAYLRMVRRVSRGERPEAAYRFGLGTADTPVADGLHDAVAGVVAATATAVQAVLDGDARRAAAFSGGLHHAMRDHASGFCVYDDASVAILRATDAGARVAYVDLDAHHGDGVQAAFYERDDVLTVSLHESGRYLFPGTGHAYELGTGAGRGWSVNLPLEPFTEDDSYLEAFDLIVPTALRAFRPDLIVLQAGADGHVHDPLAHLALTLTGMREAYRRVVALADELTDGRLVTLGGGGYEPYTVAVRAWAHAWGAASGRTVPPRLPDAWRERWRDVAGTELPVDALDGPDAYPAQPRRVLVRGHNLAVARRLVRTLSEAWGDGDAREGDATAPRKGTP